MPHTLETRARALEVLKRRRTDWLKKNGPCTQCASWDELEVDHKDPSIKVSHRIWSWAARRREEELKKCQPLCKKCHAAKTRDAAIRHGISAYMERKCRCEVCVAAKRAALRRETRRQGRNFRDPPMRSGAPGRAVSLQN